MAPVQGTYNRTMSAARAGQRADMRPVTLLSKNVEPAEGIGFGVALAQGATDEGCVPAAATTVATDFLGVSVLQRNTRVATPDRYARYDSAQIMSKGPIWAVAVAAVAAGDPVSLAANGGLTTGGAGTVIPNARWETSALAGALARVFLG